MTKLSFGQYRLVAELGQGGMADVSLALQQGPVGFNKLVVLKRPREHLADEPEFIEMLLDEARLAARLNHPNIVQTLEVGQQDGLFFIAMEYLDGQPFQRIRRRYKKKHDEPLPFEIQAYMLAEALDGLHHAHELCDYDGTHLGVIHRDVTPSNLFVTYEGQVKLVDFGIAKATSRSTETKTGVVKGKVTYMPPEQAVGADLDRRADLFAVGVILWEAAVGRRMWGGVDDVVILGKLVSSNVPVSVRAVDPSLPEALDALIAKALAPDPADRYETADEFRLAIEAYLEEDGARGGSREVRRFMNELFEEDRKRVQSLIESQLAKIENSSMSAEPIPLPTTSRMSLPSPVAGKGAASSKTPEAAVASTAAPAAPPSKVIPVLMGALAAGGVAAFLLLRDDPEASAPPAPAASATTAPVDEDPGAVDAKTIKLKLRATPTHATFVLDGKTYSNPHIDVIQSDGDDHTIEVAAEGYESKTVTVSFREDVDVNVELSEAPEVPDDEDDGGARPSYIVRPRPKPKPKPQGKPKPDLLGGDPWRD